MEPSTPLRKKIYSKLTISPLRGAIEVSTDSSSTKKIIATKFVSRLQEEFKQTFVPLLIEVFKLRQVIETYQRAKEGDPFATQLTTSPEDILRHLEEMQETIEEAKRWQEGVLSQVVRGIEETKAIISFLEEENKEPKQRSLWELLKQKLHP
jgi:hypothetical protein